MPRRKPAPERTLQERVEELERQQRWWSWCIVLAVFMVVLGFWQINGRLDDILGITGGIIGNISGILRLFIKLLHNV